MRLQIQRNRLKRGEGDQRVYDPAPIISVQQLTLTSSGACHLGSDGSYALDVHNSAHPHTRNNRGVNPISFLFTPHYDAMQDRFGNHLAVGCAGESILIEADEIVPFATVQAGIRIATKGGPIVLSDVVVAAPCQPFTAYALASADRPSTEAFKTALQYLDHGMRGFYCRLAGVGPAVISIGDEVFAA